MKVSVPAVANWVALGLIVLHKGMLPNPGSLCMKVEWPEDGQGPVVYMQQEALLLPFHSVHQILLPSELRWDSSELQNQTGAVAKEQFITWI